MLLEDWIVAQCQDTVKREIKYFIRKNKLKGCKVYLQDPQIMKQYLRQCSHLLLHKQVLYRSAMLSQEEWNASNPQKLPKESPRML